MEIQSAGERLGDSERAPQGLGTLWLRSPDASLKSLRPPWDLSASDFVSTIIPQIPEETPPQAPWTR
jgi:hypothetical protein